MNPKVDNILILGSNGVIGSALAQQLSCNHTIFTDKNTKLSCILNDSFILESNINTIVNCIGSYTNEENLFHSNFYLPLYIAQFASDLANKYQLNMNFIYISSLGITAPYSTLSLNPLELSPFVRTKVPLNKYEFSKLCFDTTLKITFSDTNFKCFSILVSNLLRDHKLPLAFKLFSILSPFRIDQSRTLPLSSTDEISDSLKDIIANISQYQSCYNVIKAYSSYSALSLLPSISSSFFKIKLPSFFSSVLPFLVNLPYRQVCSAYNFSLYFMKPPIFIIVNNPLFVAQHLQFLFPYLDSLNIYFVTSSPSGFGFNHSVLNRFIYIPITREPSFLDVLTFILFIFFVYFIGPSLVLSFTPKGALINSVPLCFTVVQYIIFTGQRWATFTGLKRIFYQTIDKFVANSCSNCYCDSHSQSKYISTSLNIRPLVLLALDLFQELIYHNFPQLII